MSTETSIATVYGVARGEKLLSGGFPSVEGARSDVDHYAAQMSAVGLEPDVRLVEYDVETTVKTSRVRAYREPVEETVVDEQPVDDGAPSA